MTVPNLITAIRIILTPIFIIYLLNDQMISALIVFFLCGISDGLDGLIARLFNQKSILGSYLDPIADKLILSGSFVVLAVREFIPPWLGVTVISRDVLIALGICVLFLTRSEISIRPSIVSKITTCFQFVTVILVLAKSPLGLPLNIYKGFFFLTGGLTVISGLHYMHGWFKMMGEGAGQEGENRP
jgi:cardiolipin synthase